MRNKITVKSGNISFSVNPFLESFGVAFILADFNLNKPRTNINYINKIKSCFYKFKTHKFIKQLKILLKKPTFKYDAPIEMALNMYYKKEPSQELLARAGLTSEEYDNLQKDFVDFMSTTNFNQFFLENKTYYLNNLHQFIEDINNYCPHQYLFDFLGLKSNNLNIVLMFGICTANYGISINNQLFCCVRPYKESRFKNEIDFSYNLPYITTLILHEFAHSFINPITEKYKEQIKNFNIKNFELAFKKNPYGKNKETVINETIIRAIECKYLKDFFNKSYNEIKENYINEGFIFIPQIEILLDNYLSERELYKNIEIFFSNIIEIFK